MTHLTGLCEHAAAGLHPTQHPDGESAACEECGRRWSVLHLDWTRTPDGRTAYHGGTHWLPGRAHSPFGFSPHPAATRFTAQAPPTEVYVR